MFVFQAEVWDLDIIRTNNSSWPVEVPDIKEGFIVVKGHSTVQTCFVWFSLSYSVSGAAVLRTVGCKKTSCEAIMIVKSQKIPNQNEVYS